VGLYTGRKPKIDPEEVRKLYDEQGLNPSAIAKRLRIARSSVYRFLPHIHKTNP
jgi:DNA invertase Pin-like site-specific DNA recombinase